MAQAVIEAVGRVSSRRKQRKTVVFLDLVVPRSVLFEGVQYFKVELKLESEDPEVQHTHRDIFPGDVVRARGKRNEEEWGTPRDWVLDMIPDEVEVVERWSVLNPRGIACLMDKTDKLSNSPILQGDGSFIIMQANEPHKDRLCEYFSETYAVELEKSASGMHSADWVLALPCGQKWPLDDKVLNSPNSPVHRLYVVTSVWPTLAAAVEELRRLAEAQSVERLRIACYPSSLTEQVVTHTSLADIPMNPKQPTHFGSIVYFHGGYAVGVDPTPPVVTGPLEPVPAHICKAYYKVEEVSLRMGWSEALDGGVALDVGAAPGGWSWCLTEVFGMRQAFAIDPGMLVLPHASSRIEHLAMLDHEALPILRERGVQVDLYCCDANVFPSKALDIFCAFRDSGMVREGARVVVTLKNMCKNKAEWSETLSEQLARFKSACPDGRQVHLLANTKFETTIIGHCTRLTS